MAALRAGKHLLLEKPMALTVADCEALAEQARTQQRLLAIGHEFRLSSLWGKVKEMIDAGAVGEPLYVLIELWRNPYRTGTEGWRYNIKHVGNWILEEPIHFFDLARWYLSGAGNPVSIYARANSRQPVHPELQDNFSALVNFPRGAYAVISQTLSAFEHHQVAKVTGTRGALWASWSGAMDRTFHPTFSLRHFDGQKLAEVPMAGTSGEVYELAEEIAMMAKAAQGNGKLSATAEDVPQGAGIRGPRRGNDVLMARHRPPVTNMSCWSSAKARLVFYDESLCHSPRMRALRPTLRCQPRPQPLHGLPAPPLGAL